jgi:hypothetical protein
MGNPFFDSLNTNRDSLDGHAHLFRRRSDPMLGRDGENVINGGTARWDR